MSEFTKLVTIDCKYQWSKRTG